MSIAITNTTGAAAQPKAGKFRELDAPFPEGKRAGQRQFFVTQRAGSLRAFEPLVEGRNGKGLAERTDDNLKKASKLMGDGNFEVAVERLKAAFESSLEEAAGKPREEADASYQKSKHIGNKLLSACAELAGRKRWKHEDMSGVLKLAEEAFETMREKGIANLHNCNAMMHFYSRAGMPDMAREIFNEIEATMHIDVVSHTTMVHAYYRAGRTRDALAFIRRSEEGIRKSEEISLLEIEVLRKLKLYGKAIRKINAFVKRVPVSEERRDLARAIKPYCLKEMGKVGKAEANFRQLVDELPFDGDAWLRAACGLVFCNGVSAEEAPHMRREIKEAVQYRNGAIRSHAAQAVRRLEWLMAEAA
ncbi:MAG: hypothetical protein WC759_02480 [Candidatus Micrarchaeia archaeon]|jgi:pentatricopeptide repeat protein